MAYADAVARAKAFLFGRQMAYRATFNAPVADLVLRDLAKFCRATKSTFDDDPYVAARLDGRREIWLRIQSHLNLTQDQLWKLHNGEEK